MNKHLQEEVYGFCFIVFVILLAAYGPEQSIATSNIQLYGKWFMGASLLSILFVTVNLYQKSVIDRLVLAITLFWTIGALVYLSNFPLIIRYYNDYTSLTFFFSLLVIGILTTFFSKAGFVGELSTNTTKVRHVSLKLLGIVFVLAQFHF